MTATSAGPDTGRRAWTILAAAIVVQMASAPGQTVGVSVFVDELVEGLDLSRSAVSGAYLVGTMAGALAMPLAGRLIDRHGLRRAVLGFGIVFGAVLMAMSGLAGFATLLVGFGLTRMFGQGALSLTSSTMVAVWFDRRRGTAMGLQAAIGGGAMALVPLLSAAVIATWGWRAAWVVLGVGVWVVLVPLGWFVVANPPRRATVPTTVPDGATTAPGVPTPEATTPAEGGDDDWPVAAVLRHPAFWVVVGAAALVGMTTTGLIFHQIDLLGTRGLTDVQAAANFLPQTLAAAAGALLAGRVADSVSARVLVPVGMLLLAAAPTMVGFVGPGWSAVSYGVVLGSAGGWMRAVEGTVLPRWYGLARIGEIRGRVLAVGVGSTAVGPFLLSMAIDLSGGYGLGLVAFAVLPLLVGVAALVVPLPAAGVAAPGRGEAVTSR